MGKNSEITVAVPTATIKYSFRTTAPVRPVKTVVAGDTMMLV